MEQVIDILSGLCIAAGIVALITGSLGLIRLPDLFSRTHAVGMMDTAGVGFIILGLIIHEGFTLVSVKLALVGIFLFFTSPIATHAVAQVAYRAGLKPILEEDRTGGRSGAGQAGPKARAAGKAPGKAAAKKARRPPPRKLLARKPAPQESRGQALMAVTLTNMLLLALLVFILVLVIRTRKLFPVVVLAGAYSLVSAAMFVNLDAVDVAFTEAAVGAGISTVLFLAAMAYLPGTEKEPPEAKGLMHILPALVVCLVGGALLIAAAVELPAVGDPSAPAHNHVAPRYLEESGSFLHIPNVVTTVLASYRGFDTFGETVVVFTAGLGVLVLLAGHTRTALRRRKDDSGNTGKGGGDA